MELVILETSDVHAYIAPTDYVAGSQFNQLGLARVATLIQKFRERYEHNLYIDNGDFIQGSPMAQFLSLCKDNPTPEPLFACLNLLKCDVMVLGNHEFNFGLTYLKKGMKSAEFPILAANVVDKHNNSLTVAGSYALFDRGGVRIAILGLVTHFVPKWEKPENIEEIQFLEPTEVAKEWVPRLREMGADLVIVSYHGGFDRDPVSGETMGLQTGENAALRIIDAVPDIDAMLTGHQHRKYAGVYKGVPLVQPGWRGDALGVVRFELELSGTTPQVLQRTAELVEVGNIKPDKAMLSAIDNLQKNVQTWLDQPIGKIKGDMLITDAFKARYEGHPYVDFINRLQMKTASVDISATSIFMGSSPGLPHEITVRNVVNNYVFSNTLAVLEVHGADLRAALERCARFFAINENGELVISKEFSEPFVQYYNYDIYAGIEYVMDIRRPPGDRIVSLTYHGKAIQDDKTYDVVMNNYRAVGGGEYPMYSPDKIKRDIQIDMTDIIVDYILNHPVLTPRKANNFKVVY